MENGKNYSIAQFIREAKEILARDEPLQEQQQAIGERMQILCKRDDLTRFGAIAGPTDGCTETFVLWREPPNIFLVLAQFDPDYKSPVHHHGTFWVVGCGYKGRDRWDIYERLDDGSKPGYAEVKLVDHVVFTPGAIGWMPPPPRAIHSHNNESRESSMELIFSATPSLPRNERLLFDVEEKTCRPTWFTGQRIAELGAHYPALQRSAQQPARPRQPLSQLLSRRMSMFCPVCMCLA